jgi:hypothetical protein
VLTRPFCKTQMLSMLEFAHTHWKTGWPTEQNRQLRSPDD